MSFKDELKQKRKELGLTQKEMAKKLGISKTTLNRLERGIFNPSAETMERFNTLDKKLPLSLNGAGDIESDISAIVEASRFEAIRSVNITLLQRNYLLGKRIFKEIMKEKRGDYGKQIIENLSRFLTEKYGLGFEKSSLYLFIRFYQNFPNIFDAVNQQSFLSWTHYRALLAVDNADARAFYEEEAYISGWSTRELQRAIHSQYYERLLSTQGKKAAQERLSKAVPAKIKDPTEYIKNPVIMEFLGLPEDKGFHESDLEQSIFDHLTEFLLEMGKGYTFVARQKYLPGLGDTDRVDLVFYNVYLRCYVLIDLKTAKLDSRDVGQLDSYVRYYDDHFKGPNDERTIGILLCAETSEDVIRYSALSDSDKLYAAKYKTYLPTEGELIREIDRQKALFLLSNKKKKS